MTTATIDAETDVEAAALVALPEGKTALEVFSAVRDVRGIHPIDDTLAKVRKQVDAFLAEGVTIDTPEGRKRIASMAYRVALAKGALKKVGDAVAKEQKELPKRIDATRAHVRETLEAWQYEVRQPLDAWEAAEEARINAIKGTIARYGAILEDWQVRGAQALKTDLAAMHAEDISEARFGEYLDAAREAHARAIETLTKAIGMAETREREAAELAELRAKNAERERIEREADEAAERAEREKQIAAKAAQDAEARLLAQQQAQADAEAAEQARRERDASNKRRVNREALDDLLANAISEDIAKAVIALVAKGKVRHMTIRY